MAAGFVGNLFHDIPHQIILLFYVAFLYSDYGYDCFQGFVSYPKLYQVTFNSNEDLIVILARHYPVFSSCFAWSTLVLYNAGMNTYQMYLECSSGTRAGAKTCLLEVKQDVGKIGNCCFYFGLGIFFIIYLFSHWCWPAFVAYYVVAPALHKEWLMAKIIFWCGVWIWGIIGLIIIIAPCVL